MTEQTLDEMIGMKAYLAATRSAVRDYLDFAALSQCTNDDAVLTALLKSDARYGHLQTASVGLEIAKALSAAAPFDLEEVVLSEYKGLAPEWHSWGRVERICRSFGERLVKRLILDQGA